MKRITWFVIGFAVALAIVSNIQAQAAAPCVTATAAPTKAATIAATAIADSPDYDTQDNPVPLGVTHVMTGTDGSSISMRVTKVTRGAKVLQAVLSANQFNDKPADGTEFMQVQIAVNYISGTGPISLNYLDFQSLSDGELTPGLEETSLPNQFAGAPFFVKAKIEHVVIIAVKIDDAAPLLGFAVKTDGTGGHYFALTK